MTVVGRLSVLMSGIFCDCNKNVVFLGALATSWQKLDTVLSFEALIENDCIEVEYLLRITRHW